MQFTDLKFRIFTYCSFLLYTNIIFVFNEALGQKKYWERFPSVSSDGHYIAYETSKYGRPEIMVLDYQTSSISRITNDNAIDGKPSWSSNGEQIIYYSTFGNTNDNFVQNFDIFLYHLKDSISLNLTRNTHFDVAPTWSPDGSHVYYTTERDSAEQLRRINLLTRADMVVLEGIEHHNAISFSPDNKSFLAITYGDNRNWDITIFDLGSLEKLQSFEHPARESQPSWSPDGSRITFSSNRGGQWNIYTMNNQGGEIINLTNDFGNSRFYDWFPNGKNMVFASDIGEEEGKYKLYIMDANGADKSRLLKGE